MAKFTLLEVHLDDATFTANAPFSSASEEESDEAPDGDEEAGVAVDSGGPGKGLLALVLVVALLVLAYLGRRKLGGSGDLPDVDVDVEEGGAGEEL